MNRLRLFYWLPGLDDFRNAAAPVGQLVFISRRKC